MAEAAKDTIYIDVDDEITGIIEKVKGSKSKIVALVLPKRAAVLQSIVNMKLLKRAAGDAKKNLVLITSEANLLPIAGVVGLHVAKNLQSKPQIPSLPETSNGVETLVDDDEVTPEEPEIDAKKPIGELAGLDVAEETIEVDNSDEPITKAAKGAAAKGAKGKGKLKVPNFERFRSRLFLAIAGMVLLFVGLFFALFVMPSAKIIVKTDTSTVNSNIAFTADANAEELSVEKKIVPAELKELKKTETEKVAATGQKDVGTKATGSVTLTNCDKDDQTVSIPAGTGVSSGGLTFITQAAVSIPPSNFTGGGSCKNDSSKEVSVTAQNAGDQYNVGARSYSVAGFGSVTGSGSAMTGGTSKVVKVVNQSDVDDAKQKITARIAQSATDELKQQLEASQLFAIIETLVTGDPAATSAPAVGAEASEVTVTAVTTYTMMGVKEDDLKKLAEDNVKDKIDTSKQKVTDAGLAQASFVITDKKQPTALKITLQTLVTAGPELDTESLKKEIAGKKRGDVISTIQARPGIRDVDVDYSPFWVSKTPKKTSKITIVFEKSSDDSNE